MEHGGFLYDSDSYADDLPYWVDVGGVSASGCALHAWTRTTCGSRRCRDSTPGTQFFDYLRDAFDTLYAEGDPAGLDRPKMLSVGLHARVVGRPARMAALERFSTTSSRARRSGSVSEWTSRDTGRPLIHRPRQRDRAGSSQFVLARGVCCRARRHFRAFAVGGGARVCLPAVRFPADAARSDVRGSVATHPPAEQVALIRAHPELARRCGWRGRAHGGVDP